jgi:hypothetical protein
VGAGGVAEAVGAGGVVVEAVGDRGVVAVTLSDDKSEPRSAAAASTIEWPVVGTRTGSAEAEAAASMAAV